MISFLFFIPPSTSTGNRKAITECVNRYHKPLAQKYFENNILFYIFKILLESICPSLAGRSLQTLVLLRRSSFCQRVVWLSKVSLIYSQRKCAVCKWNKKLDRCSV